MPPPRSKDRTSSYRRLDARRIARLHGYPVGAVVAHRLVDEWQRTDGIVMLAFEPEPELVTVAWGDDCPLDLGIVRTDNGRWWFACPGCRRRCAIVYLRPGDWPGCRTCLGLAYPSQSEGALRRAYRRRDKFAARWGWDVAKPLARPRPKGRWCRSYIAALDRLAVLEAAPLAGLAARLDRMTTSTGI
jgi:hypothetical protein